jgi:hypothetical protein
MANRNYPNSKLYSLNIYPVALNASINIGASGAVSSFNSGTGSGIAAVTKLATGVYQIQLKDNYASLLGAGFDLQSPNTGSAVTAGSFVVGTLYTITSLGTTNYNAVGIPAGITPAIGMGFVATAIGSGTGTATAVGNSGVGSVELVSNTKGMLSKQPFVANSGGYIIFQTLGATSSSVTTQIAANPASGSVILVQLLFNNSQVQ